MTAPYTPAHTTTSVTPPPAPGPFKWRKAPVCSRATPVTTLIRKTTARRPTNAGMSTKAKMGRKKDAASPLASSGRAPTGLGSSRFRGAGRPR